MICKTFQDTASWEMPFIDGKIYRYLKAVNTMF